MFQLGECYYLSNKKMALEGQKYAANNPYFLLSFSVSFTSQAFALELYFKSLKTIHDGFFVSGHSLWDLFEKLPAEYQLKIREYYKEHQVVFEAKRMKLMEADPNLKNMPKPDFSFDKTLKSSENAFPKYRYLFQENINRGECVLTGTIYATRKLIHELRPTWTPLVSFNLVV